MCVRLRVRVCVYVCVCVASVLRQQLLQFISWKVLEKWTK